MPEKIRKIDSETKNLFLEFQKNEITEFVIYNHLAKKQSMQNKKILEKLAQEEKAHYDFWKKYTKQEVKPDAFKIAQYKFFSNVFGILFTARLMEQGEKKAQENYEKIIKKIPEAKRILDEEINHEDKLAGMLKDQKLEYIGSIVLGLNDALVELTGALAGLSFALQNTAVVGLAGLITGIAAAMSMAASQYLSKKAEGDPKALTAAIYTGIAYIFTVLLLVSSFFIFSDYKIDLAITMTIALLIIATFTFFASITQKDSFIKRFMEMALISLGVAFISFLVGIGLRAWLGIEI